MILASPTTPSKFLSPTTFDVTASLTKLLFPNRPMLEALTALLLLPKIELSLVVKVFKEPKMLLFSAEELILSKLP